MNTIYKLLTLLTVICTILFVIVFYRDKQFKNNPLPKSIIYQLEIKNNSIKKKIQEKYNITFNIPIIIEPHLPNNLFGLASYKKGTIKIFLNKKRFQENATYMIDNVLPHEYAHALMFYFGDFSKKNGGHTLKWEQICKNIGGLKCNRFVNHNDILIEKLGRLH